MIIIHAKVRNYHKRNTCTMRVETVVREYFMKVKSCLWIAIFISVSLFNIG